MIASKTWREIRWMGLVYLLILELLLVPAVLLWPDIYGDLQRSGLLRKVDYDLVWNITEGITNRNEEIAWVNWAALQLFFKGVNLAGLACAVLVGTGLFARERESMTLEFLLARPVSRGRILWQKAWPSALVVVVPVFLANRSAIWWARSIDQDLDFWPLTLCCIHSSLFCLMFLAFTTFVSVLCRVQGHVAFWVGGIAILQMGVYLIPRLRRYSVFRLSDFDWYGPMLAGNLGPERMFDLVHHAGNTSWVVLATAAFYAAAWHALRRLEP